MRWFAWQFALWSLFALTMGDSAEHADPSAIGDVPIAPPEPEPAGIDAPPLDPAVRRDRVAVSGRAVVARHFIGLLERGHFAAAAESYSGDVPRPAPDEIAMTWNEWTARLGRFEDVIDTRPGRLYGRDAERALCEFAHGRADIQITFDSGGCVCGFYFLPAGGGTLSEDLYESPGYVRRAAFTDQMVEVGQPPWTLPGVISRPAGDGPFPGVVLVAGSGPQNRDGASGPIKPFREIAEGLASGAIATLRYDNRRYVYGANIAASAAYTVADEIVNDAVAAVARLRETPKVDRDRIFVLAHGLAGGLLPRIAAQAPGLAGGIILAGWTRPLEDIIVDQAAYLASLGEPDPIAGDASVDDLRAEAARVKDSAALAQLSADALVLDRPASYWRDLRDYRPAPAAAGLHLPLLILQGERDYQVTMADFAGWQQALAGQPDVQLKSYPALGHPFLPAAGPPSPDDYRLIKHVPDEVIEDIGTWVRRHR